jgi:hypothetical protein
MQNLCFLNVQLAVFTAKSKVNQESNEQPNGEINPVPNAQFCHHVKTTNQTQ